MFELIYNIEQDVGKKPDSDHKGKEEQKEKKRLIFFLLGIFSLFLKDFRVAVFFNFETKGIEIECQSWKLTKNAWTVGLLECA